MFSYAGEVLRNKEAARYSTGVAFHWYTGDRFDSLREFRKTYPGQVLLPTEAAYERRQWNGAKNPPHDWRFGEGYAHDIIGDLNAGSSGWIDWNLLLDTSGGPNHVNNMCDAAMIADTDGQRLWQHPQAHYT